MTVKRKVLIAEDEILVREGLKSIVDWEGMGMEIIGCAGNGKQALELYEKEIPDILLTDIRMPLMDGLELIARIREQDERIRIVVLSCYEEFRYLQEAMRMGVSDYILKLKMKPAEIENAMRRIRQELDESESGGPAADLRLQKEDLFKQYIFYHQIPLDVFRSRARRLQVAVREKAFLMCRLVLLGYRQVRAVSVDDGGMLARFLVSNMAEEIMRRHGAGELIWEREDCYLLVIDAVQGEEGMFAVPERLLREIARVISECLDVRAVWSVSTVGESWERLPELYLECREAFAEAWLGKEIAYAAMADRRRLLCQRKTEEACSRIRTLLPWQQEMQEKLCGVLTAQAAQGKLDAGSAAAALTEALGWCGLSAEGEAIEKIQASSTFLEAVSVYVETCRQAGQSGRLSAEIYGAVNYIDSHLEEKLSLGSVAAQVGLSPNYLSSLFKKELGVSFVDYITQKRVEQAKDLLMHTDMKTWEVAERTGFISDSYFAKTFKRITGKQPSFFRKREKK